MIFYFFLFFLFISFFFFFFFFFFQAEDGMRDLTVAGVQMCALPISSLRGRWAAGRLGTCPTERESRSAERLSCSVGQVPSRRAAHLPRSDASGERGDRCALGPELGRAPCRARPCALSRPRERTI